MLCADVFCTGEPGLEWCWRRGHLLRVTQPSLAPWQVTVGLGLAMVRQCRLQLPLMDISFPKLLEVPKRLNGGTPPPLLIILLDESNQWALGRPQ